MQSIISFNIVSPLTKRKSATFRVKNLQNHSLPQREFEEIIVGLKIGNEVVDDDEVEGQEDVTADVDDLETREGEHCNLINLKKNSYKTCTKYV